MAAVEGCKEHFLHFQLEYNQVLLAEAPSPCPCLSPMSFIGAARPCEGISHSGMYSIVRETSWHTMRSSVCVIMGACSRLQVVVMETKAASAATRDILTMHYIPHDRSEELRNAAAKNAQRKGT